MHLTEHPSSALPKRIFSLVLVLIVEGIVVQFLEIQKLRDGHIEGNGDLVERHDSGILGQAAHDVVDGGLVNAAHCGELVDGDPALLAELTDTADV